MAKYNTSKLLYLRNTGEGLLKRLYLLNKQSFQYGSLQDKMFKSGIYYHLENKFPSLEIQEKGKYDQFTAKGHAINGELENAYRTLCVVVDYLNESLGFMQKFLQEIVMFNYEINRDMTVAVLEVITLYIKIHFLIGRFEKVKLIAGAYAASFEATHVGEREREFDTLAAFLLKFAQQSDEDIITEVRKIFQADSHTIASGLFLVLNTYMKLEDFQTLRRKNVFELIVLSNETLSEVQPVTDVIYDDLRNMSKFSNWIILILMIIPDQLAAPQSKQLLKIALEDGFRIRIFRDEYLLPHPEFQKQVAQMKKMKKLLKGGVKKLINNAEFVAVEQACFKHRNRRKYLCVSLRQISNFLRVSPGLLGPKFPIIISALSVVRHELEWYFRHHQAEPEKKSFFTMSKAPTFTASHWIDTQRPHLTDEEAASVPQYHTVSELIHLSVKLQQFVKDNKDIVKDYYLGFIRGADLSAVTEAIDSGVLKHFPRVKSNMDDIRALLQSTQRMDSKTMDLRDAMASIRHKWLSTVGAIITTNVSRDTQSALNRLVERMSEMFRHTRYVDSVDYLMNRECSLKVLWWHLPIMNDLFASSISKRAANGPYSQYCISIVQWLQQGLHNVDTFVPEEQGMIGNRILKTGEDWIQKICDAVVSAIGKLLSAHNKIESTSAAIEFLQSSGGAAMVWGTESYPNEFGRAQTVLHSVATNHLGMLTSAIGSVRAFDLFRDRFVPQAYLREAIRKSAERYVQGSLNAKKHGTGLVRPYQMVEDLNRFQTLLENVAHRTLISTHKILPSVLATSDGEEGKSSFISHSCKVFWNFLSNVVSADIASVCAASNQGYAFSLVTKSFVQWKTLESRKQRYFHESRVETTPVLTAAEMESYCSLAGFDGVRRLESFLLGHVKRILTNMYKVLQINKESIGAIQRALQTPSPNFLPILSSFKHLDEFLHATIKIGNVFFFRDMLRSASGKVFGKHAPILQDWMYRALKTIRPANAESAVLEHAGLEQLSRMLGKHREPGKSVLLDADVVEIMTDLSKNDRQQLWSLLPFMYAASFLSNIWQGGFYLPHIQACANGAHAISIVVQKLLTSHAASQCLTQLSSMSSRGGMIRQKLTEPLGIYAQASIRILLEMRKNINVPMPRGFPVPLERLALRSCFIFVEMVVDMCGGLIPHSLVEEMLPHSLVQASQIDIALGVQTSKDFLSLDSLRRVIHEREGSSPGVSPSSPSR